MSKRFPVTPASKYLRSIGVNFKEHLYDYKKKGSDIAAEELGVDLHIVVKTLVLQRDDSDPFIVLMHGDKEVSLREVARQIGAKNVTPCEVRDAQRYTGYLVGGISPFGTKKELPVYVEESILELPYFYINGGQRGFILEMTPTELQKALKVTTIRVAR
jgi:Cys-tRNA(Pro) deacylase